MSAARGSNGRAAALRLTDPGTTNSLHILRQQLLSRLRDRAARNDSPAGYRRQAQQARIIATICDELARIEQEASR